MTFKNTKCDSARYIIIMHKTGSRESTRLINKALSDLWKVPTLEGHSVSDPFRSEVLAAALRRLRPESLRVWKPSSRSLYSTSGRLSKLVLWFPHFLHALTQNSKIWRRALIIAICCVSPLKSSRDSSTVVSNQSSTPCSHRTKRAFDTGGRPQTRSPCWNRASRIAFRLSRSRSCICRSHSSLRHCMAGVRKQSVATQIWIARPSTQGRVIRAGFSWCETLC